MVLAGQGEIHLKVAIEKLLSKYGLKLSTRAAARALSAKPSANPPPRAAATSASRAAMASSAMWCWRSRPPPRGQGFVFHDRIKGGVVPRQWIGSVEKGVLEYIKSGPLGFPVVDVAVALTDGSYHSVDSSDAAFQTAGRLAMSEGMPDCAPGAAGAGDQARHPCAQRRHRQGERPDRHTAGRAAGL